MSFTHSLTHPHCSFILVVFVPLSMVQASCPFHFNCFTRSLIFQRAVWSLTCYNSVVQHYNSMLRYKLLYQFAAYSLFTITKANACFQDFFICSKNNLNIGNDRNRYMTYQFLVVPLIPIKFHILLRREGPSAKWLIDRQKNISVFRH